MAPPPAAYPKYVGTYSLIVCLAGSPDATRTPTFSRQVANFGLTVPASTAEVEQGSAERRFVATLGLVLYGVDRTRPWPVHTPEAARALLAKLSAARARAAAEAHDEYHDWFVQQSALVEEALARGSQRGEWVVGVFEGDMPCFEKGGTPVHEPGQSMFAPTCIIPPPAFSMPWRALGGGAVVLGALGALAAWRYRRFQARRSPP